MRSLHSYKYSSNFTFIFLVNIEKCEGKSLPSHSITFKHVEVIHILKPWAHLIWYKLPVHTKVIGIISAFKGFYITSAFQWVVKVTCSWGMVYGIHGNMNMNMKKKMNMNMEMNMSMEEICFFILFEYYVEKWRNEMGGQRLKPLTVQKLLTTNSINPTSINNTNNHCRWLSCIVGGSLMNMGIWKWRIMRK